MADAIAAEEVLDAEDERPLLMRRPVQDTADLDITPMIDIVFLLLIFFLVSSVPDMQVEADLPPARYGEGVGESAAVIFTVADRGKGRPPQIYLGDGKIGAPLPADPAGRAAAIQTALKGQGGTLLPDDPADQENVITAAVERGYGDLGKSAVLVKAEKGVLHREVSRVAAAAARAEGIKIDLNFAVLEID